MISWWGRTNVLTFGYIGIAFRCLNMGDVAVAISGVYILIEL